MNELFRKMAARTSELMGKPWAFLIAVLTIIVWLVTGPLFKFSDTWQLIINTGTTIVTFLMVFLIQNTQNRDAKAIHLKLDELIRSTSEARNSLIDLEESADEDIQQIKDSFRQIQRDDKAALADCLNQLPDQSNAPPAAA